MSHYNVNASMPKTLIKHLVRWVAESERALLVDRQVQFDIRATEISPELAPGDTAGQPGQSTESLIGPYDLHNMFLYYLLRFGIAPSKVAYLAHHAWHSVDSGAWPEGAHVQRPAYDMAAIKKQLRGLLLRFLQTSQFKRGCVPNAPKVGSGGSLSPRGDRRAPSDSRADVWLADLERVPER